jgi:hypothetical protein
MKNAAADPEADRRLSPVKESQMGKSRLEDSASGHNPPIVDPAPSDNGQPPPAPSATPAAFDPFADLEALRLPQDFAAVAGVEKVLLNVPCCKPHASWFVRVHCDPAYSLRTGVIELKVERELYLIGPHLWSVLATEALFSSRILFCAVNRQGTVFVWPCRLPGADGKLDAWGRSALDAAARAQTAWVRVTANLSLGAYDLHRATGELSEPVWPTTPFNDLLRLAFRDRFIDDLNHPVLRQLRGEV